MIDGRFEISELGQRFAGRYAAFGDEEAWRAHRVADHRIGGSDVARILGVAPSSWGGQWSLWEERQGLAQDREGPQLERGHKWEPRVIEDYVAMLGLPIIEGTGSVSVRHPEEPWAVASPDEFAMHFGPKEVGAGAKDLRIDYLEPVPSRLLTGVEAKTSVLYQAWGEPGEIRSWDAEAAARIPAYYALQVYWYLEVTGLDAWDLVVMLPSFRDFFEVKVYRIWRDPRIQSAILKRCKAWREKHLVRGHAPALDGSDVATRHLERTHGTPPDKRRRKGTAEEFELTNQYAELGHQIEIYKEARAVAGNRLRDAIGADYGIDFGGGRRVSWYATKNRGRSLRVTGFTFEEE